MFVFLQLQNNVLIPRAFECTRFDLYCTKCTILHTKIGPDCPGDCKLHLHVKLHLHYMNTSDLNFVPIVYNKFYTMYHSV